MELGVVFSNCLAALCQGKQLRCLEDMENRKQVSAAKFEATIVPDSMPFGEVNQQRRKAYADILDRRLRAEAVP